MIIQNRRPKQTETKKIGININKGQIIGEYRKYAKRCQKNMWG